jgi:hypothetical protein
MADETATEAAPARAGSGKKMMVFGLVGVLLLGGGGGAAWFFMGGQNEEGERLWNWNPFFLIWQIEMNFGFLKSVSNWS